MRRSPRGERGLKYTNTRSVTMSRPSGRSPRGERGLKYGGDRRCLCSIDSRSPRGERGLNFESIEQSIIMDTVALLAESVD